jgi:hypothetical protein
VSKLAKDTGATRSFSRIVRRTPRRAVFEDFTATVRTQCADGIPSGLRFIISNECSCKECLNFGGSHGSLTLSISVSIASMPDLNLWKNLGHVPESVWGQTDLETLVLADNDLSEVSEQIGCLRKLRMLDLGHNQLTRVPDALGDLEGLTDFLYLHDNRLTSLPSSLARLTKLRYLNISENAFEIIPESVCAMASLTELRASDNQLTSLPDSIGQLASLRELHLRNNRLTTLPESVEMLPELRQIDLRGNPVTHLPAAITSLPKLDKLDLRWVTTLRSMEWLAQLEARGCVVYR